MFTRNVGQIFVAAVAVTALCAGAHAEKTVYKWVDEDGVAHFSDSPPAESNPGDTETLTIPKTPPNVAPAQPAATSPTVSVPVAANQSIQPQTEMPP